MRINIVGSLMCSAMRVTLLQLCSADDVVSTREIIRRIFTIRCELPNRQEGGMKVIAFMYC